MKPPPACGPKGARLARITAALLAGALPCLTGHASPSPTDVREALHQRDFLLAGALLQEGLTAQPDDPLWQLAAANLLAARGSPLQALNQIRQLRQEHPGLPSIRIREAQLLSELGHLAQCAAAYESAHDDFPEDPDVTLGLGLVYLWQGRFQEAESWLNRALLDRTTHDAAFYARLRLLTASGRLREAWSEAAELDRNGQQRDAELGLLLAGLLRGIDATDAALTLASRPHQDPELQRRQSAFQAQLRALQGRPDEAIAQVASLTALNPPDYAALILAADVYAAADRRPEARTLYDQAAVITPERPEAWLGLARLASRDGRLSGALSLYRQVVADRPDCLEAWLGIARTARLLNDPQTAHQALEQAAAIAPGSAFVARESLSQALLTGELDAFDDALSRGIRDQPRDQTLRLWDLRRLAIAGLTLDPASLTESLDLLAPQSAAQLVRLGLDRGFDIGPWLDSADAFDDPELSRRARSALARQLATLLQPTAATLVAAQGPAEDRPWIQALARGWWAFGATPWAHARELARDFDPAPTTLWLAAEVEHRLRTLAVETDSPLWEEWLLVRAYWYQTWQGYCPDPAALSALRVALHSLAEGWSAPITLSQIEAAWLSSEAIRDTQTESFDAQITRARWRFHREDPDGALRLLRRLAVDYPHALEPKQRQAEALGRIGRLQAAARVLQQACLDPQVDPGSRLALADALRRLGRVDEARDQLQLLNSTGFAEPDFFLQQALLAEAQGEPQTARHWFEAGLQHHPRAAGLFGPYAEWLLRHHRPDLLANRFRAPDPPPWTDLEHVAAIAPALDPDELDRITGAPRWWLSWDWWGWERLGQRSVRTLEMTADTLAAAGHLGDALETLRPALNSQVPRSDLWLKAARLYDLNRRYDESAQAFRHAMNLGCGRLDAEVLRLSREAHREPLRAAREFARRLEAQPDLRPLRIGLIQSLLQAGEINAANQALSPLIEEDPSDPETILLTAQVRAAQGRVHQARSLQESLLRLDPLAPDPRAARLALSDRDEWGFSVGYEAQLRHPTPSGPPETPNWQEGFANVFWRRPHSRTTDLQYQWYERSGDLDQQVAAAVALELDPLWLLRLRGAAGIDADYTSRWRGGAGVSRSLADTLSLSLDANYYDFVGVQVGQILPSLLWRWHPRGTLEGRVYFGYNWLDSGTSRGSISGLLNAGWQLGPQSLLVLSGAWGNENSANLTLDQIGGDSFRSIGLYARLGWQHRWTLTPAYRYEHHEGYVLHALGLSLAYAY